MLRNFPRPVAPTGTGFGGGRSVVLEISHDAQERTSGYLAEVAHLGPFEIEHLFVFACRLHPKALPALLA